MAKQRSNRRIISVCLSSWPEPKISQKVQIEPFESGFETNFALHDAHRCDNPVGACGNWPATAWPPEFTTWP